MKFQKPVFLAALTLLVWAATPARAAFDDLGISPRAVGLANAFTAVADDVYAIYYNPAGLAALDRPELAASYARLLAGLSDNSEVQNSFVGYAHPLAGGRQGALGLGLNYFSLTGLYQETSLFGSYSRALFPDYLSDKLYAGVSAKFLYRALTPGLAASQPISDTGYVMDGMLDSVLAHASKSAFDADFGLLYRVESRWNLGFVMQHAFEPNIAFSTTDRLGRTLKFGGSYRTPFSLVSLDVDLPKAPDGSLDKIAALAAEKWLPTLLYGTVGLRAGLSVGTRDHRELGVGLSYRIFRMQFDYGFDIPLGGLSTSGSHRLGLTYRFGRAQAPQATMAQAVLENIQDLSQVGTPEFCQQMEKLVKFQRSAVEEYLQQAKKQVASGDFADALSKVNEASSLQPNDAKITECKSRLQAVTASYPELKNFYTRPGPAAVYDGAIKFLGNDDREALANLLYAQSLNPADSRIEALIKAVEAKSGLSRGTVAASSPALAWGIIPTPAAHPAPAQVPMPQAQTVAAPVAVSTAPAALESLSVGEDAVTIKLSAAERYETRLFDGPPRLVVDFYDTENQLSVKEWAGRGRLLKHVRVAQFAREPRLITRLVLDLDRAADYRVEAAAGVMTVRVMTAATAQSQKLVAGYMAIMEADYRQSEYEKVIQLARQVLELDDTNVLAYKRMAASYHALKRDPQALAALRAALKREPDDQARKTLRQDISALEAKVASDRAAQRPSIQRKAEAMAPEEIERLYDSGVEFYAQGRLAESAEAFRRVLAADSNNVAAQKALQRVQAEMAGAGVK